MKLSGPKTATSAQGTAPQVAGQSLVRPPTGAQVSRPEAVAPASHDLQAGLAPSHRSEKFDEIDAQFIREAMALRDQQEGPRIGDFVRYADGALHRLAIDFGERGFQTMEPGRGAFYLGGADSLVFSGGSPSIAPLVEKKHLSLMDEALGGEIWTFHHQEAAPGGRVNAMVPFRVFAYIPDSTR